MRVTVDGNTTKFLKINRGVPIGTGLIFSILVNDIKSIDSKNKYDDI